jgi:hypothetical protein
MSETENADSGIDPAINANDPEVTNGNGSATTEKRRKRKLRPVDLAMLNRFRQLYPVGEAIPFKELPDVQMKRALFPSSQLRLVSLGLLDTTYDDDTGILTSVTIDPETLAAFQWEFETPARVVTPGVARGPRNQILTDDKYKIHKLRASNPCRPGTFRWLNWEHCYQDGRSVPEYMDGAYITETDRLLKNSEGKWFNGPSSQFLYADHALGYIGIYNSEISQESPNYWLKPSDIDQRFTPAVESNTNETESANLPIPERDPQADQTRAEAAE